jgi:CheY-like chemotaxis protein
MAKANILVVEDELLIAQDIREILGELDYNVVAAVDNGPDALKIACEKKPDLILMDIIIKGPWDGIRTTEEIHAVMDTPVIYLTSHADNERLQRAKITEPYGYITKPFEENTLHTTIEITLYRRKSENEKTAVKEQVTQLTRPLGLTDNEKIVFYGIIMFPELNDIELGRVLKLKRSTVTAIRNRLLKGEYFSKYRIPDFSAIGCELLTVMHANMTKEAAHKLPDEFAPEQVFAAISNKAFIGICLSRNFSDAKGYLDRLAGFLKNEGMELSFTHLPVHEETIRNFFDCSSYLKKRLNIKKEYEFNGMQKVQYRNLSRNEKLILYALVKYPSLPDTELSIKTGIPRPSISQARRALMKDGIVKVINMPSFEKLRSELLVMSNPKMGSSPVKLPSNIFMASDNTEVSTINVYDDYSAYEAEKSAEGSKAEIMLIVQNLVYIALTFAPLVKKSLDINQEF